jgi:hypothetical protein
MSGPRLALTAAEVERLDVLLVRMRAASPIGAEIDRSHALRAVVARGCDALGAELTKREHNPGPFDAGDDAAPISSTVILRFPRPPTAPEEGA